jgi:hypothetical protein
VKIRVAITALAAAASFAALVPQAHANEVCYDLKVNVQGQELVNQAGCQDLP